jgi:hypothetical protein
VWALAAFVNRGAYEFLDETLHDATHRGVFPGQGRERATLSANEITTVLLDVSHGAEFLDEAFWAEMPPVQYGTDRPLAKVYPFV